MFKLVLIPGHGCVPTEVGHRSRDWGFINTYVYKLIIHPVTTIQHTPTLSHPANYSHPTAKNQPTNHHLPTDRPTKKCSIGPHATCAAGAAAAAAAAAHAAAVPPMPDLFQSGDAPSPPKRMNECR